MGLFSWIKRSLGGGGGVGAKLEAPSSFTWNDQNLPMKVTLSGHKSEPRTVLSLAFLFQDVEKNPSSDSESKSFGRNVNYHWEHIADIQLAPGGEQTIEVFMPLPFDSVERTALAEKDPAGGFMNKMLSSMSTGAPTHIRHYVVSVKSEIEGAKTTANAKCKLQYGGARTTSVNIGGIKIR